MPSQPTKGSIIEREIKIACQQNPLIARSDLELERIEPRHFEDNWLFDFDDRRLSASRAVLRLRLVGQRGWLTYKAARQEHPWLKVREEIQIALDDPQSALALLEAIGLKRVFRYQKFRTHYRVKSLSGRSLDAVFDETPIGNFIELEGEAEAIADVAGQLNIASEEFIQASYPALWTKRHQAGEPLPDMIFSDDQLQEMMENRCEP